MLKFKKAKSHRMDFDIIHLYNNVFNQKKTMLCVAFASVYVDYDKMGCQISKIGIQNIGAHFFITKFFGISLILKHLVF